MDCKDVRQSIIDASQTGPLLTGDIQVRFERHLAKCPECRRWASDIEKLREGLRDLPVPVPSDKLLEHTRNLCLSRLEGSRRVPLAIWGAFGGLVVLTIFLMAALGVEIGQGHPLSLPAWGGLCVMIQNLLMLFSAPLVLKRFRPGHREAGRHEERDHGEHTDGFIGCV
ncbi:MAG: hypothetical protein ACE5LV_03725 [Candidatus Aminicenantales bacterium]